MVATKFISRNSKNYASQIPNVVSIFVAIFKTVIWDLIGSIQLCIDF